jgi:F420-dependent oxidoreductase-like protein
MEVAIMIEGQNGLNWPRWQAIVRLVEELGFAGLYRSDHFTNARPPDLDSLELWTSLTWLAANTSRIEFGPLVTPFSFRHPSLTARMAVAVDNLSGGRLTLGVGGGWQEREHKVFGFDLLDTKGRFDRFEEGLICLKGLLQSREPVTFQGTYFQLDGAQVLPRPDRPGGPPILVGGNGYRRTLQLAAEYASEWNANFVGPAQFEQANRHLSSLLQKQGRSQASVRRSLMTGCEFAMDLAGLQRKLGARGHTKQELLERGMLVGVADEVKKQLREYADAGVQRIMLQWLDLDDLDGLRNLAKVVL